MKKHLIAPVMVLVILFLTVPTVFAQGNLGSLQGTVRDQSGLLAPGAEVTATNMGTNLQSSTVTNEAGTYRIPALPPGPYRLSVSLQGFKTFVREPITIITATIITLDVTLEVGAATEHVEVVARVVELQTTSAEISTSLERKVLLDLPISMGGAATTGASGRRQPENFIFLTPGVQGDQWNRRINGQPRFTSEVTFEGASVSHLSGPGFIARLTPPYEAVEEFKMSNTLFPVEYGRGFNVINFSMKSGTNAFHGSVFEFLRNDRFDARSFFAKDKPIVRQNEFGFTVGGPLIKDRTFFFVAFSGFRLRGGAAQAALITMPTTAMLQGDFSEWPFPIFDPATTRPDGAGGFVRDQFMGCGGTTPNVICPARFDPVAARALQFIPAPDFPGVFNNRVSRAFRPTDEDTWSFKIDHRLSDKHRLSGTGWFTDSVREIFGSVEGEFDTGYTNPSSGSGVRLNWDYVVSPNLLNHFVFGFTPYYVPGERFERNPRLGNEVFQIPNISNDSPAFPSFFFSKGDTPTLGDGTFSIVRKDTWQYSFVNNVNWIKGKHQFTFGGEFIQKYAFWLQGRTQLGEFRFDRRSTSQPNAPEFNTWGNSFASFLVGDVFQARRVVDPPEMDWYEHITSFYAQDKFQVTPKLTVTLGLRYDIPSLIDEKQDRVSTLDLTLANPGAGGLPGALALWGEGPGRNGNTGSILGDPYMRAFSPRIALAYRFNEKTVLRTGYALFHLFTNQNRTVHGVRLRAGFAGEPFVRSTDGGITSAFLLRDGFPIPESQIPVPNADPSQLNDGQIDFINPSSHKTMINQTWTFSVQRELPSNTLLDVAYVGSKLDRLPGGLEDINFVDPSFLSLGSTLLADINSPEAAAAGITAPYAGFTGSVVQALRPFPQYTVIRNNAQPTAFSRYHALQVRMQKRYSNDMAFLVAYTLSKNLGTGGEDTFGDDLGGGAASFRALNSFNHRLEKSHLSFDQTHVFVFSWIWEFPFGSGKRFGSNWNPVLDKILGGWQFNAIHRYQSSPTIAVTGGTFMPLGSQPFNRPNWDATINARSSVSMGDFDPATDTYINIEAFSQPDAFTFGNAPRRIPNLRAPAFYDENFSVFKNIGFTETVRLQFRAEFFNLFNRVVFAAPRSNLNTPNNFGVITGQANSPRDIQFGLKLLF